VDTQLVCQPSPFLFETVRNNGDTQIVARISPISKRPSQKSQLSDTILFITRDEILPTPYNFSLSAKTSMTAKKAFVRSNQVGGDATPQGTLLPHLRKMSCDILFSLSDVSACRVMTATYECSFSDSSERIPSWYSVS
jgi:hypothetical protein